MAVTATKLSGRASIVGPERVISGGAPIDPESIKIDDGIPIPAGGGCHPKYPFARLGVGQSFFIVAVARTVAASARSHGVRHGTTFRTRAVTESGKEGVRVWRVK